MSSASRWIERSEVPPARLICVLFVILLCIPLVTGCTSEPSKRTHDSVCPADSTGVQVHLHAPLHPLLRTITSGRVAPKQGVEDAYAFPLVNQSDSSIRLEYVEVVDTPSASPLRFEGAFVSPAKRVNPMALPVGHWKGLTAVQGYELPPTVDGESTPGIVVRVGPTPHYAGKLAYSMNRNVVVFYRTSDGVCHGQRFDMQFEYPNAK